MADCFITSYVNQYTVPLYADRYGVSADNIINTFSSTFANTQSNLDGLAGTILGQGLDNFQNGKYDKAISYFKRAAAISPASEYSAKAYDYIGQSYLRQDNTDAAIKTYKEAIRIFPTRDDFHIALGNIYQTELMPEETLQEFKEAVRLNPSNTESLYSLGQSYLSDGQFAAAQAQFKAVTHLAPNSAVGYFGLGQVARAKGDIHGAVAQFKAAIKMNKNFLNSYQDLGYTYADMGDFQQAYEQLDILSAKNTTEAAKLQNYITQVEPPKIDKVTTDRGFTKLGPKTDITKLNAGLKTPDSSKMFSMSFVFSKNMDVASIINPYNWTISRADTENSGGIYNGGLKVPTTEATILPNPINIIYDDSSKTAAISFRISQNNKGNATIDPKHIVFRFSGIDAYGNAMNLSADEYSGFSGIA